MKDKPAKKPLIYAYGFDQIPLRSSPEYQGDDFDLEFVPYRSPKSLAEADGVVIPSGVFEISSSHPNGYDGRYTTLKADQHQLAERLKQFRLLYRAGKWACLLLRRVDTGHNNQWADTDLAKQMLGVVFSEFGGCDPTPHMQCKSDDFGGFFQTYGIAQTGMARARDWSQVRVLASSPNENIIYAAEFNGWLFFLPFKELVNTPDQAHLLIESAVKGILQYRRRNHFSLPEWVANLRFNRETELIRRVDELRTQTAVAEEELNTWARYKGILSASGHPLNEIVVDVLRTFFKLNLNSQENYVEDALIFDDQKNVLFVVEVKGVNGGIKREHVNQVDSHRERLGMDPTTPGLLIINDFADVESIEARRTRQIDQNHLKLAQEQNIRILRTTALFDLMMATEMAADRTDSFLAACQKGDPLVSAPHP